MFPIDMGVKFSVHLEVGGQVVLCCQCFHLVTPGISLPLRLSAEGGFSSHVLILRNVWRGF